MIYYAIPLRSKHTSNNWNNVCSQLKSTIESIHISGGEYSIIIAGHEKPEFLEDIAENISFIQATIPIPENQQGYMLDKMSKKTLAKNKILSTAKPGDLFMFFDADDLVAKSFYTDISKTFNENPAIDDIALYSGYVFDYNRKKISHLDGKSKIFYKNCGSCFISKISELDIIEFDSDNSFFSSLKDHTKFPTSSIAYGRSFVALKAPITCYIVNHGSNDSAERVGTKEIELFVDQHICKDNFLLENFRSQFSNELF